VPIRREGSLIGVLNVYVPDGHHRNDGEERFLKAAADVLAIAIDRDRGERELLRHRDHLQDLVDAATTEARIKARELEAALAKEKELNLLQRQFVSMASHEFRTPLTIIDGAVQRIQRRFGTMTAEDLGERVTKIRGAVVRMTRLIDSTLSAARMDAGKIEVSPVPCDVKTLIAEVCDRQQEIAGSHRISIDTAGLPPSILADPKAVDQIFTNLLSNAVKYAPGAPAIEVTGWTEGGMAVVSVRDHGLGIPADELPNMFGRFFRAKTSAGIAGTGIGLNLVKQLVELHRGGIHVDSVEGEGSTFTVKLPLDPGRIERRGKNRETVGREADSRDEAIAEITTVAGA
jgi:signal transduction histidine kinase